MTQPERILEALRAGPSTSKELGERLGIKWRCVSAHLSALMIRGKLRRRLIPQPFGGRPMYRYSLPQSRKNHEKRSEANV